MYLFLDTITFGYRVAPAPALDRLCLFVRSGEIAETAASARSGSIENVDHLAEDSRRICFEQGKPCVYEDPDKLGTKANASTIQGTSTPSDIER